MEVQNPQAQIRKPIICLDFDGVIHSYASGWKGAHIVPDEPVPGALEFILKATDHFEVHIYSARSGQPGGIDAMQGWLWEAFRAQLLDKDGCNAVIYEAIQWPTEKPPAFVSIDDRCLLFTGQFPGIEELQNFKPWNAKGV